MDTAESYLEIRLQGMGYALSTKLVREIDPLSEITPLPHSAAHICGLMNLRGQVVPVIDLSVRLGLAKATRGRESCIVIVAGTRGLMGLLVDAVSRVIELSSESLLLPPETCHLQERSLVCAVVKEPDRILTVLDVPRCLDEAPAPPSINSSYTEISSQAVKLLS